MPSLKGTCAGACSNGKPLSTLDFTQEGFRISEMRTQGLWLPSADQMVQFFPAGPGPTQPPQGLTSNNGSQCREGFLRASGRFLEVLLGLSPKAE